MANVEARNTKLLVCLHEPIEQEQEVATAKEEEEEYRDVGWTGRKGGSEAREGNDLW